MFNRAHALFTCNLRAGIELSVNVKLSAMTASKQRKQSCGRVQTAALPPDIATKAANLGEQPVVLYHSYGRQYQAGAWAYF